VEEMANLCVARRGVVIKQRLGRDQYARDAISAWHRAAPSPIAYRLRGEAVGVIS